MEEVRHYGIFTLLRLACVMDPSTAPTDPTRWKTATASNSRSLPAGFLMGLYVKKSK